MRGTSTTRALAAQEKNRAERAALATAFRQSLLAQLRASRGGPDAALDPATLALLDSAVSAHVEIAKTSAQFIAGRASSKAMWRMNNARSELRRALRALGLIGDAGEVAAPPPSAPTDESVREVVARFGGAPKEAASGANESH